MSKNFVSEVGFEIAGISLHLGFNPHGQPMMAVGVDRSKNTADHTVAPLDDESIVRLLAFVNRALVSRLDIVKQSVNDQTKSESNHNTEVISFKPKG